MGLFSLKQPEPKQEQNAGLPIYYVKGQYYYLKNNRLVEVPKSEHPKSPHSTQFKV